MSFVDRTLGKLQELLPELGQSAYEFIDSARRDGAPVIVVEAFRTQARQEALYAQGRTRPGSVVTWTRSSLHTQRRAFDIAFVVGGRVTYSVPYAWWHYMRLLAPTFGLRTLGETSGDLGHFER